MGISSCHVGEPLDRVLVHARGQRHEWRAAPTNSGRIAIRRRLAGVPARGENDLGAGIVAGRVGREQPRPRREFE